VAECHLLESDPLGAFTEANLRTQGGTLFLDEVGGLSPAVQGTLLTFLNTRVRHPPGSATSPVADVRLIAATIQDLNECVRRKAFRMDLLDRLKVRQIRIPSLAERPEDAIPLAIHFSEQAVTSLGLPHVTLSPGALRAVEAAEWIGNVRELAHVILAGVVRASANGSSVIEAIHIFGKDVKA
jgi:Nif-specific regulatory protein